MSLKAFAPCGRRHYPGAVALTGSGLEALLILQVGFGEVVDFVDSFVFRSSMVRRGFFND